MTTDVHDGNGRQDDGFEEESVYVLLELPDTEQLPKPGTKLLLEGMDTAEPKLAWEGGPTLLGSYEETVGTQLLFQDDIRVDGTHDVALQCQTTNRVRFRKAPVAEPQPPASAPDALQEKQGQQDRQQQQQAAQEEQPQQQQQQQAGAQEHKGGGEEEMQT